LSASPPSASPVNPTFRADDVTARDVLAHHPPPKGLGGRLCANVGLPRFPTLRRLGLPILVMASGIGLLGGCTGADPSSEPGTDPILVLSGPPGEPFREVRHAGASPRDGAIHVLDRQGLHVFTPSGDHVQSLEVATVPRPGGRAAWSFAWTPEGVLVLRDGGGCFTLTDGNDALPPCSAEVQGNLPPYLPRFRPDGCAVELRSRLGAVEGERLPRRLDALLHCAGGTVIDSLSLPVTWTVRLPTSRRTPPPMGNGPVAAVDREGQYWFAERRGLHLIGLSPTGDTLVRHDVDAVPRPLPHDERARWAEGWTSLLEVSSASVPETETIGRALVPSEDEDKVLYFIRTATDDEGSVADLFTWEEYLGRFHFSEPMLLLHHQPTFRGEHLVGVAQGPGDQQRVVVYRIQTPPVSRP